MLFIATGAVGAVGVGSVAWPFIHQMNPDASTIAAGAAIDVDLSAIPEGSSVTVKWRGKPIFVRHRTAKEIKEAVDVPLAQLPDPQADAQRVKKPEWLVVIGVCTHLGCTPTVSTPQQPEGEYGGWLCHCHGSAYDTAGRIRKGPAPRNLDVPTYSIKSDTRIKDG
jgi:ubiquinol-cytochrome c reductase iron-sulfur subunit